MSFISAKLNPAFAQYIHKLSGTEKEKIDELLSDIRMMHNKTANEHGEAHQGTGNARLYSKAGVWVRDVSFLKGINTGGARLIYSQVTQSEAEKRAGHAGHVNVYGIGDPHDSSGFNQVQSFSQISWIVGGSFSN